jgi:membrane carboxypeptidase/penicillin-binding protein
MGGGGVFNDSYRFATSLQILLQSGLMAMEPQTGNIKSMGYQLQILSIRSRTGARQVGSTFKPFVYATNRAVKHVSLRLDH